MQEIRHFSKLTRDEEFEYFRQLRAGNTKMHNELISRNLLFVISVAKQYQGLAHGALTLEDLIAEGNVGLCLAIDRYDYTKGHKFISYAVFWIKHAILGCLRDNIKNIRVPQNRQAILHKLNQLEREMEQQQDYHIDVTTLALRAVELGLLSEQDAVSNLSRLKNDCVDTRSFSKPINNHSTGEELTLLDVLTDDNSLAPDARLHDVDMKSGIQVMLNTLPEHVKCMIELYHGINTYKSLNYKQIGMVCDLTSERIRQLINKYTRKLSRNFSEEKEYMMT